MNKREEAIMWKQFITESPWMSSPLPDKFDQQMSSYTSEDIKNKYEFVEKFQDGEIYGNDNELALIFDNALVSYYQYQPKETHIQTKMSWQRKGSNGVFSKFFAEYIIPRFKVVESDYGLTPSAFNMWKKLIILYPQYNFYAKDDDKLYRLTDPMDVYTYQDPIIKDPNSTFIAEYHE